jgi:hypothetical protein
VIFDRGWRNFRHPFPCESYLLRDLLGPCTVRSGRRRSCSVRLGAVASRHVRHPSLRPATSDEVAQSLSFALRFNGKKREHGADEIMAQITANRLIEHLERSGYVVMCKPGSAPHRVDLGAATDKATKIRREE